MAKQFKIKLEDRDNLRDLLQEIYSEACKNIEEAQRLINKIEMSTNLNEEIIDGKSKYAKAINDFIATKDKAIGRKLDVAKTLADVLKINGSAQPLYVEGSLPDIWDDTQLPEVTLDNKSVEYKLK